MQVIDVHLYLKCHSSQVFFKHFASENQLPGFYISGTLVENGLINTILQNGRLRQQMAGWKAIVLTLNSNSSFLPYFKIHELISMKIGDGNYNWRSAWIYKPHLAKTLSIFFINWFILVFTVLSLIVSKCFMRKLKSVGTVIEEKDAIADYFKVFCKEIKESWDSNSRERCNSRLFQSVL